MTNASTHFSRQPTAEVSVTHGKRGARFSTVAIADTGVQVYVARPYGPTPNIRPMLLQDQTGLRDVADLVHKCPRSSVCSITLGSRLTEQDIYFVQSAKAFFLLLDVCKELGLVPENFPHNSVSGTHTQAVEGTAHAPTQQSTRPSSLPFPPLEEHVT